MGVRLPVWVAEHQLGCSGCRWAISRGLRDAPTIESRRPTASNAHSNAPSFICPFQVMPTSTRKHESESGRNTSGAGWVSMVDSCGAAGLGPTCVKQPFAVPSPACGAETLHVLRFFPQPVVLTVGVSVWWGCHQNQSRSSVSPVKIGAAAERERRPQRAHGSTPTGSLAGYDGGGRVSRPVARLFSSASSADGSSDARMAMLPRCVPARASSPPQALLRGLLVLEIAIFG
ncbi:hypothetical protein LXA43DRAFT_592339 [Ganoderma leucocontextum]|nr:hypothetical protein LXA43DRAFT_592339 [Ganoderma leucocontextum]